MSDTIPAISIKQPWAWLIVNGFKDIENREWASYYRGRILIHAGKKADEDFDYAWAEEMIGRPIPRDLPLGAIVGEAVMNGCHRTHPSPWFFGKFGFKLEQQKAYPQPIPRRGKLGIFQVFQSELPA